MKTEPAGTRSAAVPPTPKRLSPTLRATLPGMSYSAHRIAFSPDSRFLASGGHCSGDRLWRAPDFSQFHVLGSGDHVVTGLTFSPNSQLLAVGSTGDVVSIWNTETGAEVRSFEVKGTCRDVAFSPDGSRLAAAVGKSVCLWDVATGAVAKIPSRSIVESVAFHPDGRLIVKAGKLVTLGGAGGGSAPPLVIENQGAPSTVQLSPDGRTLLAAGGKFHVRLWDAVSGEAGLVLGTDLDSEPYSASFSPDGQMILTSDDEGTARLWEVATGRLRKTWSGSDDGCTAGALFSPDGRLVAVQSDELRLYDVAADANGGGEPAAVLPFVADEGCLAFSPDGTFLAAGSSRALMVWALY